MRIKGLLLTMALWLSSLLVHCQVQDDFQDGDFTQNPVWIGDTAKFRVNPSFELQLFDTSKTSPSYLSTASKAIFKASWEFKFNLGFNPSTSNYAIAYLGAQKSDLSSGPDGYYVRIGGASGSVDDFSLYKKTGSTNTKIIDGTDGRAAVAPSGWIKVTRDSLGNWELLTDTSAQHTGYFSEGTAFDNTHLVSEYFGFYCRYSATRSELFFFDSVTVTGQFYTDTVKPTVQSVKVLSNQTIDVTFSELIDPTTAQNTNHYQVDQGIGNPSSAALDVSDSTLVHLQFTNPFPSGVSHQITIQNVEDRNGNVMLAHNESFTWFKSDTAKPGDIIINEIMADPSPAVALPEKEYVELLNLSSGTFNLDGFTFSDPTRTADFPSVQLAPGEYVILCATADSLDLAPYGRVIPLSNFPSLNNAGDQLTLADSSGQVIDEVTYSDSWYGSDEKEDGGFSLELINPNDPCLGGASSWTGSESVDGGTPGSKNSVFDTVPPTTSPSITSAEWVTPQSIRLHFSALMDSASLMQATYTVSPINSVSTVTVPASPSGEVLLNLFSNIVPGQVYYISVSGASDCYGNPITSDSVSFGIGKFPARFDLIMDELYPDPDGTVSNLPESEFVELYNASGQLLSLDSCTLSDASKSVYLTGGLVEPGEYLILCEASAVSEFRVYGPTLGLSDWPSLNNSGDQLTLRCRSGVIHQVDYTSDWYQDENKKDGGWTLEMVDPENRCGEADNWRASTNSEGGTPGKINSVDGTNADEKAPELVRGGVISDTTLFLLFDEDISTTDSSSLSIELSPHITVTGWAYSDRKTIEVSLSWGLEAHTIYEVTVSGVQDCSGNLAEELSTRIGLAEQAETGDVVINELLFNPYPGASSDYVEIYNKSDKILDLRQWQLCEFDYVKDTLDGCKTISASPYSLFPGEFVLINKDNSEIARLYPTHNTQAFIELESMPSFSNDAGAAVLLNDSSTQIDRMDYDEEMHNALIRDPEGVSLERVSYTNSTLDRGNWNSAAEAIGFGTPGLENSQYLPATDFSQQFTVEPETFSPDNDGFDDVVHLNYSLPNPGLVAQVQIYDTDGRLAKDLANNEVLGTQGSFTWNGTTDDGQKAKTGIYIFFIELIDPSGNTEQFKKTCVLALRF